MDSERTGILGAFAGMVWGLVAFRAMGPGGLVAMGIVWACMVAPAWRMTVEVRERHLVRSGYTADEGVYRHARWLGWVRYDDSACLWESQDASGIERREDNMTRILRESGAPALVGVPS